MANKGFITDWLGNQMLPITRGELVLDQHGQVALHSMDFIADIEKNLPGLMTAAEKAMLSGSGNGQSLTDIYTKLDYINTGLKVNGRPLTFYNTQTGAQTVINITQTGGLVLGTVDNGINIGLEELKTADTTVSQILKSITLDKYGRVTAVTGAPLTNEEIPTELTGKTITNSTLNGCLTAATEIANDAKAIVNKGYVDQAIQNVTGVATGALKFAGSVDNSDDAVTIVSNANNNNKYYKVTKDFELSSEYIHQETATINQYGKIKAGDTLIVYTNSQSVTKFVHIPSGNDITAITVKEQGQSGNVMTSEIGEIEFQFSSLFDVSLVTGTQRTLSIAIPKADGSTDGYLSKSDYALFSSYADSLAVSYTSIVPTSGNDIYQIGTITVGTTPYTIYGKNNVSDLTLNNGTVNNYNPILKFSETGSKDKDITFKGLNGIQVRKVNNDIEILSALAIDSNSTKYLELTEDYKLKAKIGTVNNGVVTDGLTDYAEFVYLKASVLTQGVIFASIDYSLKSETTPGDKDPYRYGNDSLREAVKITI